MELTDLTREQLMLLNTNFPEEIEKEASVIADDELGKFAEMEDVAASCMTYGADLAMQKIAEMEENYKKKDEKEKSKDEDEDGEDESEKNASAMGQFILEGYWNTMMEKGAEYYEDENIYIEELCKEAGYAEMAAKMKGYAGAASKKMKDFAGSASKKMKDSKAYKKGEEFAGRQKKRYSEGGDAARQAFTGKTRGPLGTPLNVNRKTQAKKALRSFAPELGILAGTGALVGGKKMYDKRR